MPSITLSLSSLAVQRLEEILAAHNAAAGTSLTLAAWLTRRLIREAAADEFSLRFKEINAEQELRRMQALEDAMTEIEAKYL